MQCRAILPIERLKISSGYLIATCCTFYRSISFNRMKNASDSFGSGILYLILVGDFVLLLLISMFVRVRFGHVEVKHWLRFGCRGMCVVLSYLYFMCFSSCFHFDFSFFLPILSLFQLFVSV